MSKLINDQCPRCKRLAERDGHAYWCDGTPPVIETPGSAPVTVRWMEPTAQEPQTGRQFRADDQTIALDRPRPKMGKPGTSGEVLDVDGNPQPVKRKPAKPKPTPKSEVSAARSCERCGASLSGRHGYTRFCTEACRKAAQYRRLRDKRAGGADTAKPREVALAPRPCAYDPCGDVFTPRAVTGKYCSQRCAKNASNAKRVEWFKDYHRRKRREAALAEAGETAETRICVDCGKPRPIGFFRGTRGHGRRKDCIDCHGAKVIAGKARKRGAA